MHHAQQPLRLRFRQWTARRAERRRMAQLHKNQPRRERLVQMLHQAYARHIHQHRLFSQRALWVYIFFFLFFTRSIVIYIGSDLKNGFRNWCNEDLVLEFDIPRFVNNWRLRRSWYSNRSEWRIRDFELSLSEFVRMIAEDKLI